MIPYSLTRNTRYYVLLTIFFSGSLTQPILIEALRSFPGISQAVVGSISVVLLISAIYMTFDNFLWKLPAKFGVPFVPDFSGRWWGYITERVLFVQSGSSNQFTRVIEKNLPVEMIIEQTFSGINISFGSLEEDTEASNFSQNTTAVGIGSDDSSIPRIRYMYSRSFLSGEAALEMRKDSEGTWLSGPYTSNKPRVGHLRLPRARKRDGQLFCGTIELMKTANGGEYVGISVDYKYVEQLLKRFKKKVSSTEYRSMRNSQSERDGNAFHLTVVEPAELSSRTSETLSPDIGRGIVTDRKVWVLLRYLGRAEKGSDIAYYVTARSEILQEIRKSLSLPPKAFHVTLGFRGKDVHDVNKGDDSGI